MNYPPRNCGSSTRANLRSIASEPVGCPNIGRSWARTRTLASRRTIEKIAIGGGDESALIIRSVQHNRFVCITEGRLVTVDPSMVQFSDRCVYWNLQPAHKNQFFVTSLALQKRISWGESDNGEEASKLCFSENHKDSEEWTVEFVEPGFVVFKKRNKTGGDQDDDDDDDDWQYLSCFNDGSVTLSRDVFHWLVEPLGPVFAFPADPSFFRWMRQAS